jgi:hypothetical protein
MRKLTWILMCMLILVASFAFAIKPSPGTQTAGTLSVEAIQVPYYKYNDTLAKVNIHVFNSTGYMVNNVTTSCLIHIYNETGRHVVDALMVMDLNLVDYQYTLPLEITSIEGAHGYIIQCNNTKEAGFSAGQLTIARGDSLDDPTNYIGIALVLGVFIFALFAIGLGLKDDHYPLKLFLIWIGILLFIPLTQIGTQIAKINALINGVFTLMVLFNYISIFVGIVTTFYFVVYVLTKTLMALKEVGKNQLRKA